MSLIKTVNGNFEFSGVNGFYELRKKCGNYVHIFFYDNADKNKSGVGFKKSKFVGNASLGNFDPPKNNTDFDSQIKQQICAHAQRWLNEHAL